MDDLKFTILVPEVPQVDMAVLTQHQYEALHDIEFCFDSLAKIALGDDFPEFVHYLTLFSYLSSSFARLMEEIEETQPESSGGNHV